MLPRTRRKAGFTLVELLVVLAIIATMLALVTAGIQRARVTRDQTENTHRMSKIAAALAGLKEPGNGLNLDYVPSTGFRLQSSYTQTDPEYYILKKAWPNLDMSNTGLPNNVTLDGNQTLLFFLTGGAVTDNTGFHTNPKYPFQRGGSRKGPYLEVNNSLILAAPNGHYWLIDPWGTPYAYFGGKGMDGRQGAYTNQTFTVPAGLFTPEPTPAALRPLHRGGNPLKYVNPDGFQIISAGNDRIFGPGGALPTTSGTGEDDMGHFQDGVLSAIN